MAFQVVEMDTILKIDSGETGESLEVVVNKHVDGSLTLAVTVDDEDNQTSKTLATLIVPVPKHFKK